MCVAIPPIINLCRVFFRVGGGNDVSGVVATVWLCNCEFYCFQQNFVGIDYLDGNRFACHNKGGGFCSRIREGYTACCTFPTCKILAVGSFTGCDCNGLPTACKGQVCRTTLNRNGVRSVAVNRLNANVARRHYKGGGGCSCINEYNVFAADNDPLLKCLAYFGSVCSDCYGNTATNLAHGGFVNGCAAVFYLKVKGGAICLYGKLQIVPNGAKAAGFVSAAEKGRIFAVDKSCDVVVINKVGIVGCELDVNTIGFANCKQFTVHHFNVVPFFFVPTQPTAKLYVAMNLTVLFNNVLGEHTCNGCCNVYGYILLEHLCCDRRFKDDVFAIFATLKENSIRTVAAKGVIDTHIGEIQLGEIVACRGGKADLYSIDLVGFKYVVSLQKVFALVPSKHLPVVIIPLIQSYTIRGGATNNRMGYVSIQIVGAGERLILSLNNDIIIKGRRRANRKGERGQTVVGDTDDRTVNIRRIPLFEYLSLGIERFIGLESENRTGKELSLVGLYTIKIERTARNFNTNKKQIGDIHVGANDCGSYVVTAKASYLSVNGKFSILAHAIPFLGNDVISALVEFVS